MCTTSIVSTTTAATATTTETLVGLEAVSAELASAGCLTRSIALVPGGFCIPSSLLESFALGG
jgi:hypothetical protein